MIYKTGREREMCGDAATSTGENRSLREKVKERNRWGVEEGFDVTMYHCNGRCELQILIAGQ